ncbi:MAG: peptidyl-prolyl cis-trans isomerase, FKBP-type [Pseudomonadota bacterium]|jgi:FKBP-type peptidyl-prolyl cis-trans isomerase FkpA/FKBP-type peptidyl-prolyl cis-trans isomerase FklB
MAICSAMIPDRNFTLQLRESFMQRHLITLLTLIVTASGCDAVKKISGSKKLESNDDRVSYAIGQQIGSSIKSQGIPVNTAVLAASIDDVLKGAPSRLKPEEMQDAMVKMREGMVAKQEAAGKENLDKGEKFLEENKKKPNVKVTASGLQYEVLSPGKGRSPKESDIVKVHYKGTLIDGTQFDSSYERNEPAEFPVGGVIKGWTEALQMMKAGAKWKLAIPAQLAYGPQGRPGIPPNSVLAFDVELLEIKSNTATKK